LKSKNFMQILYDPFHRPIVLMDTYKFTPKHFFYTWRNAPKIVGPKENYYLSPWSRVLLEKLTGIRLAKKFPAFYKTLK
jgi:hypothetical protein